MRFLAPLLVVLIAVTFGIGLLTASAQQPLITTTTISGGGLAHSIRLAPVDQDAFMRRLELPPLLDDQPELKGPSYTVASPYWDVGVRAGDNSQVLVDDNATYYPEGGFVKTRQAGKDIWTALSTTQRAVLDRYISVAAALPPEPSVFEVMRAAGLNGEDIGITIGDVEMTKEQRTKFWDNARNLTSRNVSTSAIADLNSPANSWLVFTMPEGRSVSMIYANAAGIFAELTEANDGKAFAVPQDWLVPVLGDQARLNAASNPLAPVAIPQDATDGSPIWWLVTIGGGIASIALAFVLQRKLRSLHASPESSASS